MLPFTALPFLAGRVGEASGEGALFPATAAALLFVVSVLTGSKIPNRMVVLAVLFFLTSVMISFVFNYTKIYSNYYLGVDGVVRFFQQYALLCLCIFYSFSLSICINSERALDRTFHVARVSFLFVCSFAVFQYFAYHHGGSILIFFKYIGQLVYEPGVVDFALNVRAGLGLHSVAQEPSHLAVYLAVVFPLSLVGLRRGYVLILLSMYVFLVLLTWSRTLYITSLIQLSVFLYMYLFGFLSVWRVVCFSIISILLLLLFFLSDSFVVSVIISTFDVENSGSSAARLGALFSALSLWFDGNHWLGVGLGQAGFDLMHYLPEWSFLSNDSHDVYNGYRWPAIHNLLVRIFCEVGFIGGAGFLAIFLLVFNKLNNSLKRESSFLTHGLRVELAVFISLVGAFVTMGNREVITNFSLWFSLGVAMACLSIAAKSRSNNINSNVMVGSCD